MNICPPHCLEAMETQHHGDWIPINFAGKDPWKLAKTHQGRVKLWTHHDVGCYDKDYSLMWPLSKAEDIKDFVQLLLKNIVPGTLVQAEFRSQSRVDFREAPFNQVHALPTLSTSLEGVHAVGLKKELWEDQRRALKALMDMERSPATQEIVFQAFARAPEELFLKRDHFACLRRDFCMSRLSPEQRSRFLNLPLSKAKIVMEEPGLIVDQVDDGARRKVSICWTFPDEEVFVVNVEQKHVCPRPTLDGPLQVPGRAVRLLRGDSRHCIGPGDTGLVLSCNGSLATVFFPQCRSWTGPVDRLAAATSPFFADVELRVVVKYELRGSICAQAMGWGKTALIIALIRKSFEEAESLGRARETSLIIVPSKIFRQWENELQAWLELRREIRNEAARGRPMQTSDGSLRIWACADMRDFNRQSSEDAFSIDVLLIPSSIFASKQFLGMCETLLRGRIWTRVILDEAHEIANLPDPVQKSILALRRSFTHLLTGTPQQGIGALGAARLALLMNVSLSSDKLLQSPTFRLNEDTLVNLMASHFFSKTTLTDESPFDLPVEYRELWVQLTKAEEVIYNNLKYHHGRAPSQRQLLELCSCFVQEGSRSAYKEVKVLTDLREKDLELLQARVMGHLSVALFLAQILDKVEGLLKRLEQLRCPPREESRIDTWLTGKARIQQLLLKMVEEEAPEQLARRMPSTEDIRGTVTQSFVIAVRAYAMHRREAHQSSGEQVRVAGMDEVAEAALKEQLSLYLSHDFVEVGEALKALEFLQRSLRELKEVGTSCPVCLDALDNGEATCMPQCGHSFHETCLACSIQEKKSCPTCRQLVSGIYVTKPPDPWLKYGTKVKQIIGTLKQIMTDYPGERILVFVQFKSMRKNLELAFKEFKVPFLTLCGSTRSQGASIDRWQTGADPADFVMMLSCEEHNSGITLTRARHRLSVQSTTTYMFTYRERGREQVRTIE